MSTKATTTRLTFGKDAATPATAPAEGSSSTTPPPAGSDKTPAGTRRGAPTDRDGRPEPVEQPPGEIGGSDRLEPTRYGDWEVGGRCTDF
jgi:hypothetical protein